MCCAKDWKLFSMTNKGLEVWRFGGVASTSVGGPSWSASVR